MYCGTCSRTNCTGLRPCELPCQPTAATQRKSTFHSVKTDSDTVTGRIQTSLNWGRVPIFRHRGWQAPSLLRLSVLSPSPSPSLLRLSVTVDPPLPPPTPDHTSTPRPPPTLGQPSPPGPSSDSRSTLPSLRLPLPSPPLSRPALPSLSRSFLSVSPSLTHAFSCSPFSRSPPQLNHSLALSLFRA
eukprot:3667274-Rhodomonas_salina.1